MFSLGSNPSFGYLPDIGLDIPLSSYVNITSTTMENDFEYSVYCSTFADEVAKSYRYNIKTVSGQDMCHLRFVLRDLKTWDEYKKKYPLKSIKLLDIYNSGKLKKFSTINELSLQVFIIDSDGQLDILHQHVYPGWTKQANLILYSNRRNIPYPYLQNAFRDVGYHFIPIINWEKFKQSPLFQRSPNVQKEAVIPCTNM